MHRLQLPTNILRIASGILPYLHFLWIVLCGPDEPVPDKCRCQAFEESIIVRRGPVRNREVTWPERQHVLRFLQHLQDEG